MMPSTVDHRAALRVHESAHAAIAEVHHVRVHELVVGDAGKTSRCLHDPARPDDPDAQLAQLRLSLAGPEAEAIATADYAYGSRPVSSPDEDDAETAARSLARLRGGLWREILRSERAATRRLLEAEWRSIAALARSLELADDYLDGADLQAALAASAHGRAWDRSAAVPASATTALPASVAARSARRVSLARHVRQRPGPGVTLEALEAGAPLPPLGRYALTEHHGQAIR
jgi:hypothetical protein